MKNVGAKVFMPLAKEQTLYSFQKFSAHQIMSYLKMSALWPIEEKESNARNKWLRCDFTTYVRV